MLLAEMAFKTGIPQHELADMFTTTEISEIIAYKNIEWRTQSKEDSRFAMLAYHTVTSNLAAAGGKKAVRGIKPKTFLMDWGKAAESVKPMSREDIGKAFAALRGLWRCKVTKGGTNVRTTS